MKLFKKSNIVESKEDNPKNLYKEELKKMSKKQRNKSLKLLEEFNKGLVLVPQQDIDNKQRIIEIRGRH